MSLFKLPEFFYVKFNHRSRRRMAKRRCHLTYSGQTRFPTLEHLEPRMVLATITVTSLADNTTADNNDVAAVAEAAPSSTIIVTSLYDNLDVDNEVTLREAIERANTTEAVDRIEFQAGLTGTIELINAVTSLESELGEFQITKAVTIQGLGAANTRIYGGCARIFNITSAAGPVTLDGLTLSPSKSVSCMGDSEVITDGGAIHSASSALLTVINSTISGNSALEYGGGIYAEEGDVVVANSVISGNSALEGGGIYAKEGGAMVTNSTISGNSAGDYGGGITVWEGDVVVTNSTISRNSAGDEGGGMYTEEGDFTIHSSIVAGNTDSGKEEGDEEEEEAGPDMRLVSGTLTVTNSLIGDNTGTDLSEATTPDDAGNLVGDPGGSGIMDPMLERLAKYGGATETHALMPGSPAIDLGSNAHLSLTNDQRGSGLARTYDDPDVTNSSHADADGTDAGAFELPHQNQAGDANTDGKFSSDDIMAILAARKYETGLPARWDQGDWNGDGFFTSADIILALATGHYEQGPYAASSTSPVSQAAIPSAAHASRMAQVATDAVFTAIGDRALATDEANAPGHEQDHAGQLRMRSVSAGMKPFRIRQTRAHIDMAEVPLWSPFQPRAVDAAFGVAWLGVAPGEPRLAWL